MALCLIAMAGTSPAAATGGVANTTAVTNTPKPGAELGTGPMVITAESFTADRETGTALFDVSVTAKNNDVTLHADKMLVYYAEGGDVTKIDSSGHVSFATKEGTITSDFSVYYADEKKMVFTGGPKAVEGSSVVTGTEIVYYIDQEKYKVKNSKVLFEGKKKKAQSPPPQQQQPAK